MPDLETKENTAPEKDADDPKSKTPAPTPDKDQQAQPKGQGGGGILTQLANFCVRVLTLGIVKNAFSGGGGKSSPQQKPGSENSQGTQGGAASDVNNQKSVEDMPKEDLYAAKAQQSNITGQEAQKSAEKVAEGQDPKTPVQQHNAGATL